MLFQRLGIMTAAYLHVVAATQWITEASQSLFRWQVGDVIRERTVPADQQHGAVPEGDGSVSSSTRPPWSAGRGISRITVR